MIVLIMLQCQAGSDIEAGASMSDPAAIDSVRVQRPCAHGHGPSRERAGSQAAIARARTLPTYSTCITAGTNDQSRLDSCRISSSYYCY